MIPVTPKQRERLDELASEMLALARLALASVASSNVGLAMLALAWCSSKGSFRTCSFGTFGFEL